MHNLLLLEYIFNTRFLASPIYRTVLYHRAYQTIHTMQCLKPALPSNSPLILCISFLFPQFSAASLVLASLASLGATQPLIAAALAVRCCARCWRQRRQSACFGICAWTACLIYQRQSQSHSLSSLFLSVRYSPSVFPSEILFSSLSSVSFPPRFQPPIPDSHPATRSRLLTQHAHTCDTNCPTCPTLHL